MAIKLATTRTEPFPGAKVKFTVTSADAGDGQYELLPIPKGYKGISIKMSGTDGSAVCKIVYKNATDGTFEDFQSGSLAAGQELNVNCGEFSEPYLHVGSSTGSTDLDVEASIFRG